MVKIAIIGAGSHVFARRLITDLLTYPELRESTITLMDIDREALALTTAFAKRVVEQHRFKTKVESTLDRREALEAADYVIVSIRVGGTEANRLDLMIPAKYGVNQGIGDLPPQCAALNRTNINVQELGVKAAVERDKTLAFQAILVDPLTSAVLTIDETWRMVNEMFEAEKEFLKDFR
ncbi:hypothetical protein J7L06_05395 [Candidatus Bathyarchaeota archaeon]|nr:hypothetical protein [Candidatus Bathyarchaeota archaeon]